ncbi:hypothetical protein CEXT_126441 [Caerostris extrusa]|uniref:Uncharacterized protein n=1 Tax=Caerostris extrusa TaxID=172846 RepID=A0AAV4NRA5_CAEEX|nr:hypothetical protein CEXT_126441 [Caerostris extrusa]
MGCHASPAPLTARPPQHKEISQPPGAPFPTCNRQKMEGMVGKKSPSPDIQPPRDDAMGGDKSKRKIGKSSNEYLDQDMKLAEPLWKPSLSTPPPTGWDWLRTHTHAQKKKKGTRGRINLKIKVLYV